MPKRGRSRTKGSKEKGNGKKLKEKVVEVLELPKEITLDLPKITILGNRNLLLENYKGIIEYDSNKIKINTMDGVISVEGENLVIKEITSEDLMVDGNITRWNFDVAWGV